jgi:hypothetical protein
VLFSSFSSISAAGFRPMRRAERDGLRFVRLDSSPPFPHFEAEHGTPIASPSRVDKRLGSVADRSA